MRNVMSLIRPEVRTLILRWREVILAGFILMVGLWWGMTSFGLTQWLGWAVALAGGALGFAAAQRVRFGKGGGGIGVVQVDERRLSYFGPLSGGVIDLDDLTTLELDPLAYPVPHWRLRAMGGQQVDIPIDAEGVEALFDAFASLPGLRTAQMIEVLTHVPTAPVRLWQRNSPRLH